MRVPGSQLVRMLTVLALAGCDGGKTVLDERPTSPGRYMSIVDGGDQSAAVGSVLPVDLEVRVVDGEQHGVGGLEIAWTVIQGGGSVVPTRSVTDASGYAATSWTLGGALGRQRVTAVSWGLKTAWFEASARAGPPAALVLLRGDGQVGKVLSPLADPFVVRVTDAFGNAVPSAPVVWSAFDSLGTVTPDTSLSNDDGEAEAEWMPASVGEDSVSASVGELDPVIFKATAEVLHFSQVAAEGWSTCALDELGRVLCWGADVTGTLGRGYPSPARSYCIIPSARAPCEWLPLPVHGGLSYTALGDGVQGETCAISDGQVLCWGNNVEHVPKVSQSGAQYVDVGMGWGFACGLTSEGGVVCWGSNAGGTLGNPDAADACPNQACGSLPIQVAGLGGVSRIAVGELHVCALLDTGRVYCWGDNSHGNVGVPIRQTDLCPILSYCEPTPVPVDTDLRFIDIAAGGYFTCGIATDQRIYCWGANGVQQRGGSSLSQPLASDRSFARIWAGASHSCALDEEGFAYCWGWNVDRQLGDGVATEPARAGAAPVAGGIRFKELSAGQLHSCGVSVDGLVFCWGSNGLLQSGQPIPMDLPTPVALLSGVP